MKIDKGKIYAVVGENGCGKTTFFNQLFKKYHNKKIIHIQQNDLLIKDLNIKSHLELVHYNFNNDELNQLLDLDRIKKLYPSQLSLGQRQIVAVIYAIYSGNDYIIFDETFSALDQVSLYTLLELCQKQVIHLNKTIFIVTHQQDIIDQCHTVIHFDNKCNNFELSSLDNKEIKHISLKEVFQFQERHWIKHLLTLFILALCLLFISLTFEIKNHIYSQINSNISKHMSTETFILNNTNIYHSYGGTYDIYYSSITADEYQQLTEINELTDFKAFIPFSIEPKRKNNEIYFEPIYIISNNTEKQINLDTNSIYYIHPYTSYSRMNESILYQTSHQDGMILNKNFCNQLGIELKDLENTTIKMTISIPVSQTVSHDGMSVAVDNENDYRNIEGREIEYQEISMTFAIKGILDEEGPFIARDYAIGFLDIDVMNNLFEKVNINYQPNAYFAQISNIDQYENIQNKIETILPTLEFYTIYDLFKISNITAHSIHMLSIISMIPSLLFIFIILYTIIIKRKSRLSFYDKLICLGYHTKMCITWIFKKYIFDICLFLLIYFILFLLGHYVLLFIHYPPIQLNMIYIMSSFLLICIIPIGVDYYALHKKYSTSME